MVRRFPDSLLVVRVSLWKVRPIPSVMRLLQVVLSIRVSWPLSLLPVASRTMVTIQILQRSNLSAWLIVQVRPLLCHLQRRLQLLPVQQMAKDSLLTRSMANAISTFSLLPAMAVRLMPTRSTAMNSPSQVRVSVTLNCCRIPVVVPILPVSRSWLVPISTVISLVIQTRPIPLTCSRQAR